MSSSVSTGRFRRTRGHSPPVLRAAPQAAPWRRFRDQFQRVDRSVQTDARAQPARPESGTASGALSRGPETGRRPLPRMGEISNLALPDLRPARYTFQLGGPNYPQKDG